MKIKSPFYRPAGIPRNHGFCPEFADPILKFALSQQPMQQRQRSYKSLFGFDLGVTHSSGESAQVRWALNFVAIYCLLHMDRRLGFVRDLEVLCDLKIDVLRVHYAAGSFSGFLEGDLRKVAHLPLSNKAVQRALRKAVRLNFKLACPVLVTDAKSGFVAQLEDLPAVRVHEALEDSFAKALDNKGSRIVRQPGLWLSEEEWRSVYSLHQLKIVYAPAQTCKKGGRSVQF